MILVDSNVFIDSSRGLPEAKAWLAAHEADIVLSGFVFMEVVLGAPQKADLARIQRYFKKFDMVWLDKSGYSLARSIVETLGRKQSTGTVDALIAASAIEMNVPLYTRNVKHFKGIKDLIVLEPYKVPPKIPP